MPDEVGFAAGVVGVWMVHLRSDPSDLGPLTGFVMDSSGAVVPNAAVKVRNEGTGFVSNATTDSSGFYNVIQILAGQYSVSVTEEGFKTYEKQHIEVQIDSNLDCTLAGRRGPFQTAAGPSGLISRVRIV